MGYQFCLCGLKYQNVVPRGRRTAQVPPSCQLHGTVPSWQCCHLVRANFLVQSWSGLRNGNPVFGTIKSPEYGGYFSSSVPGAGEQTSAGRRNTGREGETVIGGTRSSCRKEKEKGLKPAQDSQTMLKPFVPSTSFCCRVQTQGIFTSIIRLCFLRKGWSNCPCF